jgi:ATP-binding cassette subfamily F protein 3
MPVVSSMHLAGIAKAYGDRTVLADVSLRAGPGDRFAIIGRNGAGKTTLLRIAAGEIAPDAGDVGIPRGWRVALHDQRPPRADDRSLGGYVGELLGDVEAIEAELARLEAAMAGGDHDERTLHAYADAQAALDRVGGYTWRVHVESVVRGLGFTDADLARPLASFSGGELTRAALARTLSARPDLLLLDEPTNHLDLANLAWLEGELADFPGAILVVSHDRWFLEAVATGIVDVGRGRTKTYPLGYSAYRRQRILEETQAAEAFARQEEEIRRLERFVERFRAGTRARQAQSRAKRLERIERHERPQRERALSFGFPKTTRPGRVVLDVEDLVLDVDGRRLVEHGTFALERGRRMAVIGPNGAGKTTLIETLLGLRSPTAGRIKLGHNVEAAFFSQHADELPEQATVLEAMSAGSPLTTLECRTVLGRFLFPGDEVEKRIEVLSGGERRRVSLARLVTSGANLLVLDEPTNHLDVEAREALEAALDAYDGTVLFVSHDRAFIDALADETLSLEADTLVRRDGDYNDFVRATTAAPAPVEHAPKRPARAARGGRPSSSRLKRRVLELEAKIDVTEQAIVTLEGELADASVRQDRDLLEATARAHRERQEELAWLLREWEEAGAAAEAGASQ